MGEIRFEIDGADIAAAQLVKAATELETEAVYAVGTPIEYGVHQEFGTSFHAPQPYLRPAVEQTQREMEGILGGTDSFDGSLAEMAKRVRDRARSNAPVETGTLRDSIRMERRK